MTEEGLKYEKRIASLEEEIDRLKERAKYKDFQIARYEGEIRGLKFALRCDGVSGAEVSE